MNYFAYSSAAERYAKARPFFHPLAANKIRTVCCHSARLGRALDVGCGTGQSALALLDVADEVIGVDSSAEMLAHATRHDRIRYVEAKAEQLPFDEASFGLLSVGLAFHWFDRQAFLAEAQRVLRRSAWLVIYNDFFCGRMIGNDEYLVWHREQYLKRYPTPARNRESLSDSDALKYGFVPCAVDEFTHEVEFTPGQLVSYLLTQTNVIAAVETGKEHLTAASGWLLDSVGPLFTNETEQFPFGCEMRFLQRS